MKLRKKVRVNESKKKNSWKMRTIFLGLATLGLAPTAIADSGGAHFDGGYIGPLPASWFANDPCRTEPITFFEDTFVLEWQVDVSAVRDDGDPNTFARCLLEANNQTNTCIVGLPDGSVVGCEDESGPHLHPTDGDMLYISISRFDTNLCDVFVGTHDKFGEPDPKCRETSGTGGSGSGGSSSGGLGCSAVNSTPVVKATGTQLFEGQCYSFNKANGTLKVGTWSGTPFNIEIEDSSMNSVSASVANGGYTDVGGVADGTIFFMVDVPGATSVTGQVDNW